MAQIVIGAAGAALGFAIGGPAGAQWGWMAGSMIGGALFRDKGEQGGAAPSIMDLKITGTDYGQTIPWIRGSAGVAGQVWWNTDRRPHSVTTYSGGGGGGKGGGGGGAPASSSTTTTYDMDLLIGLTDNEIVGISRVWNNGNLVYTASAGADDGSLDASINTDQWTRMTVYTGAADQLPDPTYEAAVGAGNAPAYRGRGSVFVEGLNLGQSGQVPNLTFEVVVDGAVAGAMSPWTLHPAAPATPNQWNGVAYGNGTFVAVGTEGLELNQVMTSPDGDNWTNHSLGNQQWKGVTFGNGQFVAIAYTSGPELVATSPDGIVWTPRSTAGLNDGWCTIAYGNGIWVSTSQAGGGNTVMTSVDDCLSWTDHPMPNLNAYRGLAFGGGIFAAVCPDGTPPYQAATSPDGVSWTVRECPTGQWNGICYGAGQFVACSLDGKIMTSPDGVTWTEQTGSINNSLFGITYGNGVFVAAGYRSGAPPATGIVSSPDGVTWVHNEFDPELAQWLSIAFGNGRFVVVSANGANRTASSVVASLERVSTDPPTVQTVVASLCERAGLSPEQYDVSALSAITRKVRSLAVAQIEATRSTLELLESVYFFEMVVSDKLYFRPRGGAAAASIPFIDLGAATGDQPSEPFALKQVNELEIPAQIALTYINIANDYQADTQYSDRLISATAGTVSPIMLSIGMTPDEAKSVVDVMLLDRAASVVSTTLSLLGDYCRLEPTDAVNVTNSEGWSFRMRLIKKTDSYPLLTFDALLDDVSILASQGITSADYSSSSIVAPAVDTVMELLDIPILRDEHDDAGFYVAAKGDSPYPGSSIYSSPDDVDFLKRGTVAEAAVMGSCTTTLGAWTGARVFDEANSVTVNVGAGTLSGSTREALLNGWINLALVGDEIIQFRTTTIESAGIYTLSGLVRGGRGTEWAMSGHGPAERFVFFQEAGMTRLAMPTPELGLTRYYKGVTAGRALSTATSKPFVDNGVGLKPFSPVDLRTTRDGTDIVLTWQRRDRLATRMIGPLGIYVPLSEASEAYDLVIYTDDTYATELRTISVTAPTATYSTADQITDGLTPGDPVYVRIFQRSVVVGRGYPLEAAA